MPTLPNTTADRLSSAGTASPMSLIEADLEAGCVRVRRVDRTWRFRVGAHHGIAYVDDSWLLMELSTRRRRLLTIELLERNAATWGNAKHVLLDTGCIGVRAEVPLDGFHGSTGAANRNAILDALTGLSHAVGSKAISAVRTRPAPVGSGLGRDESLAMLCGESGWAFVERESGRIDIDLGVPRQPELQATVAPRPNGASDVTIELLPAGDVPTHPASLSAVVALMLSVSAHVRLARAVVLPSPEGRAAGFAVTLSQGRTVEELVHALTALSAAAEECGRELSALSQDAGLAEAFMQIRHPSLTTRRRSLRSRIATLSKEHAS
jgi:hypothetical protein